MDKELIEKLYKLLDEIPITSTNKKQIELVREALDNKDFNNAMTGLQNLKYGFIYDTNVQKEELLEKAKTDTLVSQAPKIDQNKKSKAKNNEKNTNETKDKAENNKSNKKTVYEPTEDNLYPEELMDNRLEEIYIGLLLSDPRSISKYYFIAEDCYFANEDILSLYKLVLFSDGEAYAPEVAKDNFNFAKDVETIYPLKEQYKLLVRSKKYDFEKIYVELRKLFILRKNYLRIPIKNIQDKIIDIINYELYYKMSIEEVSNAITQAEVTSKFKSAVLNDNITDFLVSGGNNLVNGLDLPFPILSSVFKGIRKSEVTSFAMPSNAGKSRFTINLIAHIALVHKQKVLVISNEMSEEKMKLCLITTVINNPKIQQIHGQTLKISESELLDLKFKPDNPEAVKLDQNGYILKEKNESQENYINKLKTYSSDFNKVLLVTDWLSKQINNSIYFINITEHTNDELNKVIKNYYYKEHLAYIFYDTLKADTENIGNSDAVKKTATILSNLAQDFNIFIRFNYAAYRKFYITC